MKQMKKLMGLILAMVMVFTMAMPAMAATGDNTIRLTTNMSGHEYSAYQIFTGTFGNEQLASINWGDGINKDDLNDIIAELAAIDGINFEENTPTAENTSAEDVAKALVGLVDDSETMQAVAKVFGDHLDTAAKTSSAVTDTDGKTTGYVIENLADGYYLVADTTGLTDEAVKEGFARTRYILHVVDDVTADVKAEVPEVEKKIVEEQRVVDANNAGIGQVVSYQLSADVPDHTGYVKYFYEMTDTFSKGLTFNKDITVTLNGNKLTKDVDYVITTSTTPTDSFKIEFKKIKDYTAGDDILVTYSATVNSEAEIGNAGNPNTVYITYSNDPNKSEGGTPGTPEFPVGKTPEDKTITYVAAIDITKTDDKGKELAGAEFTLTGTSKQTVLESGIYFMEDKDGTYFLLKNGTYTETPAAEDTVDLYVSTTVKYKEVKADKKTIVDTPVKMVVTSDANGRVYFEGLGEGTYTIEETLVPEGYNKAANVTVVIECEEPDKVIKGDEKAKWTIGEGTTDGVTLKDAGENAFTYSGVYLGTIVNRSGIVLPSTGGIGTTIFYVIGAVLVLGAAVTFVTRKRMSR